MKSKFKEFIYAGEYEQAEILLKDAEESVIYHIIMNFAYDEESMEDISILGFLTYMVNKTQDEFWYTMIITLLIHPFCHFEGAYAWAFFYAKERLKINRSVGNLEMVLFFYEIPEHLLSADEAKKIAEEILTLDSENQIASEILRK